VVAATVASTASSAGELIIRIGDVTSTDGDVRVALYADEGGFDERKTYRATSLPAAVPEVEVRLRDVPAGTYAVLVHHDVNGDGLLDRGRFGIPTEPWTGSTAGTRFRAPGWRAYRFEVPPEGLSISMTF